MTQRKPHQASVQVCLRAGSRRRAFTALVASALLCATTLLAQTTGVVTGRVYDERTGKSLEGAVVRVAGTDIQDYTSADGRFSLTAPAGPATVEIEYVGLDLFVKAVDVAPGTTTLNAPLTSTVYKMDSFVVQDTVRGQSLAINMQRVAPGIVNIVSEETFGQMVDANVGTALQRLPGLSVNEDNDGSTAGINIRGIEGDYNSVQIDGNRAPNPGGNTRAFNSNQFMADGVTNIEVIKAPTPDRDGDAIGGIINVVTRSAFQRDGRDFKLKLGGVYSDLPKKWGHQASLQYTDIFTIGDGMEKNLGISLTASSYKTNRYSRNADMDWIHVTPANNPQLNLERYGDYPVWFFEATHFEYDTRVTDTYGLSGSIDFRTDEHNSYYVRPLYSHFERRGITFETDMDIDTRFEDRVGGRKTYAFLTHDSGGATPGSSGSRGSRGWIGTDEDNYNDLYSVAFGGKHERPDTLLTWDLFYSYSKNTVLNDTELNTLMEPDNPWIVQEYKIHKIHQGDVEVKVTNGVDITNLGLMTEGELIERSSLKEENIYSARVDWERKFTLERGAFTFKTGLKHRMSKPDFDRTELRYDMDEDFPYDRVMKPTSEFFMMKAKYFDVFPRLGQALQDTNPELFSPNIGASVEGSTLRDYSAEEGTSAGYLMGTYRLGAHTVIGGVRYEQNTWKSQRRRVEYVNQVPNPITSDLKNDYDFWLPGIHLRHELRKNLILRESFNQSYGKPKLGELTLGRVVATNGNITDGNPDLKPVTSDNFDAQIEYYTANSGLYSIGVFLKKVKDFSFQLDNRFETTDANGNPIIIPGATSGLRYRRYENGGSAEQYGVELIARQRLTMLPWLFKNVTAAVSATKSESEAVYPHRTDRTDLPLRGFSPYLFTASLEYARGGLRIRGDYRYRDDYVEGLGADIESDEFYAAEERVDAEISYQIRKGLSIYASGVNLTKRYQVSYQGYPMFVEDASNAGRKLTVGMEYKF